MMKHGTEPDIPASTPVDSDHGLLEIGNEPLIAPGVRGDVHDTPAGLYIPIIFAEREGGGDVGRYLDALPRDRRVVFPCVISVRLAGMLVRRGFAPAFDHSEDFGEIDVYERRSVSGIKTGSGARR